MRVEINTTYTRVYQFAELSDIDSPDFRADFEDLCEANNWEFLENGTMYKKKVLTNTLNYDIL